MDSRRGSSLLRLKRFGRGGAIERIVRVVALWRVKRGRRNGGGKEVNGVSLGGMVVVVVADSIALLVQKSLDFSKSRRAA